MNFTDYEDMGNGAYRFRTPDGQARTFTGGPAAEYARDIDSRRISEDRLNAVGNQPGTAPALRDLEQQTGAQFAGAPNYEQRIAQSEQQIAELDRQRGAMERLGPAYESAKGQGVLREQEVSRMRQSTPSASRDSMYGQGVVRESEPTSASRKPTFEEQMAKAARDINALDRETRATSSAGNEGVIAEREPATAPDASATAMLSDSQSEGVIRESEAGPIQRSRQNRLDLIAELQQMMGQGNMSEEDVARFKAIMSKYGGSGG